MRLTKWQRNNCKGMREIQWAQVTVSKQYREHAFRKPPSTIMDGGWIKGSFDPWQRSLFVPPVSSANTKEKGPLLAGKLAEHSKRKKLKQGPGRVFSGSGIWPKYGAGFGKTQNILTGFGFDCYEGSGIHQIWVRDADFVACLSGIREIVTTPKTLTAAKANQPGERQISSKGLIYILNLLALQKLVLFNVFLGKKKRNSG